jgi:hypothetical protein
MPEYGEYDVRRYSNPDSFLTDPVDTFEDVAEPVPPGTKATPRPPGKERIPSSPDEPTVAALVARIESALAVIHAALAEIKRLQNPPQEPPQPQSKAG